ncbi:MAG TPA: hypothetical protein VFU05_08310 [Cyclobacteriaceae bacterium]|nr:hypothetical protein [Cyclobacteriaceae bacterium]
MLNRVFVAVFFILNGIFCQAQVSNNDIKDRTELILNAVPTPSNTYNSSVEWSCINKALTNKCLVYHNDQWFHFTPNRTGKFYLNVSSQQCRDQQGIQVIILEGNPCEIKTYKIRQCISKVHQDDVFIELDSLKPGTQYLVNIDGFLGDFCEFNIQFSAIPAGLPRVTRNLDTLNMKASLKDSVVTIQWTVDESMADGIKKFNVYRIGGDGPKSRLVGELPLRANALGDFDKEYLLRDSLTQPGKYTYRIFGIQNETESPILLDEQRLSFYPRRNRVPSEGSKWVNISLNFSEGERYQVLVFDKVDYALLRKYTGEFDAVKDATFEINLNEFIATGVREFIVLATDADSKKSKEFYFLYDGSKIVKQ